MSTNISATMQLTRPLYLGGFGAVALVAGVLNIPRLLALSLSADGKFSGSTEAELLALRWGSVGIGVLLLLVAWALPLVAARAVGLHRKLTDDVRIWSEQSPSLRPEQWNVAWSIATVGYLASMLGVLFIGRGYAVGNVPNYYLLLTEESGLYETLTAVMLWVASVFLLRASLRLLRTYGASGWVRFVLPASLGVLLFLAACEEVSWGQHYLGFATPEAMVEFNVQGEFNLHNVGGYWANNMLLAFFVVFVGVLPILARCFWDVRYACERLHIPVASLLLVPIALMSFIFDEREPFASLFYHPVWRLSELREALFGIVMLALCGEFWIRLSTSDAGDRIRESTGSADR